MTNDEAIRALREAAESLSDLWDCSEDADGDCTDEHPCSTHADLDRLYEAIETVERALGRKE
jgi:hypothetical protein